MEVLADTVTIIRLFSATGKIGRKAGSILRKIENGEGHCFISVVSLVEILYLSEKNRIPIDLAGTIRRVNESGNYTITDLTPPIIALAEKHPFVEIFDRLLIATALYLGSPLLSSDGKIQQSGLVETIW